MALQVSNLLDNRLPLLKLRALLPRFKAKGVLRSKQEEAALELLAKAITLAAAAMIDLFVWWTLNQRRSVGVWSVF